MKSFVLCLFVVLLVGCATSNFSRTITTPLPPNDGPVDILESLPEKYTEVGWISCETTNDYPAVKLIDMAKSGAMKNGANAIIVNSDSIKLTFGRNALVCRAIIYER